MEAIVNSPRDEVLLSTSTGRVRYDWAKVEREYVNGQLNESTGKVTYPSLSDLSNKYQISMGRLCRKCAEDEWVEKRTMYQSYMKEQSDVAYMREACYRVATQNSDTLRQMQRFGQVINDHLDQHEAGEKELSPKDLMLLVQASEKVRESFIKVFGEPKKAEDIYEETYRKYEKKKEVEASKRVTDEDIIEVIRAIKAKTVEAEVIESDVTDADARSE